jgi:peptidoglycan/LPS O-acetylase OafA/YrhL
MMENPALTESLGENETFVSITMVRAIAITAVIMENYFSALPWNAGYSMPDMLALLVAEVSGTFVQVFFVLSGYGLTLSYFRQAPPSWAAWARHRFLRILVPYWIAVIATFALANVSQCWTPAGEQHVWSWTTLLAYLTFTRNFYNPGWELNWTLWFMPVIVGLYAIFPVLILVLKRYGLAVLVAGALLVANGAVALCVYLGYPLEHQNTLPVFFLDQFAMGMALGSIVHDHPGIIRKLMGPGYFILGICFYALSFYIIRYQPLGGGSSTYNDVFTAIGLYLMMLCICRWINVSFSPGVLKLMNSVSRSSYIMYLAHGPIIYYIIKPYLGEWFRTDVNSMPMILSACIFVMLLYVIVEGTTMLVRRAA